MRLHLDVLRGGTPGRGGGKPGGDGIEGGKGGGGGGGGEGGGRGGGEGGGELGGLPGGLPGGEGGRGGIGGGEGGDGIEGGEGGGGGGDGFAGGRSASECSVHNPTVRVNGNLQSGEGGEEWSWQTRALYKGGSNRAETHGGLGGGVSGDGEGGGGGGEGGVGGGCGGAGGGSGAIMVFVIGPLQSTHSTRVSSVPLHTCLLIDRTSSSTVALRAMDRRRPTGQNSESRICP